MSRKPRWVPRVVADARRDLVAGHRAEADRIEAENRARARRFPQLPAQLKRLQEEMEGFAAYHRDCSEGIRRATMVWVTGEMTRLALSESQHLPAFGLEHCPHPYGLMAFAEPLPAKSINSIDGMALRRKDYSPGGPTWREPVPVDAIAWRTRADSAGGLQVTLLCRPDRLPAPYLGVPLRYLVPFLDLTTPRLTNIQELEFASREGQQYQRLAGGDSLAVLAFLATCWHLMSRPSMAERQHLDTRRGAITATPHGIQRTDLVSIIDLRPLKQVHATHDQHTGRRLTVRHLVRGHWRNQPHGTGRSQRRRQYIEPYIKGPEGAPLITETIRVWRHHDG